MTSRMKPRAHRVILPLLLMMFLPAAAQVEPTAEQRSGEHLRPVLHRHNGVCRRRVVQRPVLDVLFRPEEIHAHSVEGVGDLTPLGERHIEMGDHRGGLLLQHLLVGKAQHHRLAAVEAAHVDADFFTGKEPADR